ncbi:MAG: M14-type cytosolic carboxypeptidase [Planctomycetota bacterium]
MRKQLGNTSAWLIALVLAAVGNNAAAVITLDADFDNGSLLDYTVGSSRLGVTVELVGRDNFYGNGRWRWVHFRADGVNGQQPFFRIDDNFAGGASRLTDHSMVYSYDQENWHFFDSNGLTVNNGGQFFFNNSTPFTQDSVYVAYSLPYTYGMAVDHTTEVIASPWAEPTSSRVSGQRAGAMGIIGQSPGGVDDLGRTINPHNIYAYRITNPATDSPTQAKRKVVIATGQHPAENLGMHTFAGLVDWLVSDDPRATALRDVAEFYAYPTLNPDGVFAGMNRTTVENPTQDPNSRWSPSKWIGHEDIQINGEAMIADTQATPGGVDAFIDFHSTWPSFPDEDFGFIEFEQNDNQAVWWRTLLDELQPNVTEIDSTSPLSSSTSANFAELELGAEVDVTFENQHGFDRPVEYYTDLGKNFGLAFFADFVDPLDGDVNLDGFVSQADLNAVLLNWGAAAESLLEGDLTGDGTVGQPDLNQVLLNWGGGDLPNGSVSAIPEPSTAAWALLAGAAVLRRCRLR